MSGYTISDTATISNNRVFDSRPQHSASQNDSDPTVNEKSDTASESNNSIKNLPAVYQPKNVVSAGQLLAHKYPVAYAAENYEKALQELYFVLIGIGTFLFLVYLGWAAVQQINFLAGGDFIYNSGLVGGILMLVALIYSICKRVRFLRRHISSDTWYYLHIGCGTVGALLVTLHSSFDLGSTNSSVAFYCMLLVIISGALGRYLLTLFSITLHRQYAEVRKLEPEVFSHLDRYDCNRSNLIRKRLSRFAIRCLRQPNSILKFLVRTVSVPYHAVYFYFTSTRQMKKIIKTNAENAGLSKIEIKALKKTKNQLLRQYVFQITKMGYITLLEHLFLHWRILHVPLLYILAITSTVHVVVVHMY